MSRNEKRIEVSVVLLRQRLVCFLAARSSVHLDDSLPKWRRLVCHGFAKGFGFQPVHAWLRGCPTHGRIHSRPPARTFVRAIDIIKLVSLRFDSLCDQDSPLQAGGRNENCLGKKTSPTRSNNKNKITFASMMMMLLLLLLLLLLLGSATD
uniref:Uncharacterized protein n=1 Tax=Anopheles atroparvus TaxID=41427 RepID=A0A182J6Q9_ANOAO